MTNPSHPALKGGSRKLLLLAALFCLIALMGAVWLFWTFFAPTPLTIAPPDSLNQAASSQSAPGELTIHLDQSTCQKTGHVLHPHFEAAHLTGGIVVSPIGQQRTLQGGDRAAQFEAAGDGRISPQLCITPE